MDYRTFHQAVHLYFLPDFRLSGFSIQVKFHDWSDVWMFTMSLGRDVTNKANACRVGQGIFFVSFYNMLLSITINAFFLIQYGN